MPLRNVFLLLSFVFALSSCALKPIKETANLRISNDVKNTTDLLLKQANKCWKRDQSFSGDGVRVESYKSTKETNTIQVTRFARDLRPQKPVLIVEVIPDGKKGSRLIVQEGDWACNFLAQCKPMGFSADLQKWMDGDLSCGKLEF